MSFLNISVQKFKTHVILSLFKTVLNIILKIFQIHKHHLKYLHKIKDKNNK